MNLAEFGGKYPRSKRSISTSKLQEHQPHLAITVTSISTTPG